MNKLSIGVAIPCYKGHVDILQQLLESIEKQTRKPDKVVVSCSSWNEEKFPYSRESYSFPIEFIVHPEKKVVAENRNCAADHLDTDIITFIDADDTMHPQRLEIIEYCFQDYNVAILLHNYEQNILQEFITYDPIRNFHLNRLIRCPKGSTNHLDYPKQAIIHNGQPSVPRSIFQAIRFNETPFCYGREDTVFCATIIHRFPNHTAYCPYPLSKYIPSKTCGIAD